MIGIDVVLLVAILILFSPRATGLPAHEWLGLALGVPLVVHLLFSWGWIGRRTRGLVARDDTRARINYLLNWLLFILFVIEVVSGVVISRVALPAMGVHWIEDRSWRALHNLTLNYTLLVLGLHVAMNWRPLLAGVRRHLRLTAPAHE